MSEPGIPFYTGTSGLVVPVPNKLYYPEAFRNKSRLAYYGSLFNSIEINSSFYKVPQATTVGRWAASVPEDFKFTFKLFKEITHLKDLIFDPQALSHFLDVIDQVGIKKGCLLIQFPPSIKITHKTQLTNLLGAIKENRSGDLWKLAVEFRDPSWYVQSIYELLDQFNATLVLHDIPKSRISVLKTRSGTVYVRFHGPKGDYRGDYDPETLHNWSSLISNWIFNGKTVYAYFNNTLGDAIKNMLNLTSLILQNE